MDLRTDRGNGRSPAHSHRQPADPRGAGHQGTQHLGRGPGSVDVSRSRGLEKRGRRYRRLLRQTRWSVAGRVAEATGRFAQEAVGGSPMVIVRAAERGRLSSRRPTKNPASQQDAGSWRKGKLEFLGDFAGGL